MRPISNAPRPPELPQLRKKFKFGDTWITLNRAVGEALLLDSSEKRLARCDEQVKPSSRNRRNAVTVVDTSTRLMTNGQKWPTRDDWLIGPDNTIHYAPGLKKLRTSEWFGTHIVSKPSNSLETLKAVTQPAQRDKQKSTEKDGSEQKQFDDE